MAWSFAKRHQEALWGGGKYSWRRWVGAAACVAGMVGGVGAKAQISAPFVFTGQVLHIETPDWESDTPYVIAAPAYFDVADGVQAHIASTIKAQVGSPNGLYKLGGGTLRLSGQTSYRGSTRLLQGGLHVDGPQVFGGLTGIGAIGGTQLEYSPGVTVGRPLTLSEQRIDEVLAAAYYTPVAPPPGMEGAVRWRVEEGAAVHAGLLQGGAPFIKQGLGLLDITGDAMAYTGQARVAEGALAINEIFSGSVTVHDGARLQGTGTLAGARIERGGTLAPGSGASVLAEAASVMGAAGFTAGAAAGAPVGKAPGAGVGTLTVTGDVHFEPGSRFLVDATPAGVADYLQVGGKALLEGEVAVLAQQGGWQASTSYSILNARGGLADSRFAGVSSDLAFLTPSLAYSADTVTLTLMRNDTPIDEVGETPDEEEVGEVIEETVPPDEPGKDIDEAVPPDGVVDAGRDPPKANPELNESIVGLDKDDARLALQQLTGSWNASVLSSVWDDSRFLREAVLRRTAMSAMNMGTYPAARKVRTSGQVGGHANGHVGGLANEADAIGVSEPAAEGVRALSSRTRIEPWAEVFHSNHIRDNFDGILGDKRRLDGFVLGFAAAVHDFWTVGGYFGVQRSQIDRDQARATADIDSTHFGANIAGQIENVRVALGAARTLHRLASSRIVRAGTLSDALRARYRGHTNQVFGEASWPLWQRPFGQSSRFTLTPFGRLAWVDTRFDAYSESGGAAALNVQRAGLSGWVSTLGLRMEAAVSGAHSAGAAGGERGSVSSGANGAMNGNARDGVGKVYVQIGWDHSSRDKAESAQAFRDSATQTLFTSQGLPPTRNAWSLQVGMDARVGKATDIGFGYLGRFGSGVSDQGVGGWARIAF